MGGVPISGQIAITIHSVLASLVDVLHTVFYPPFF